MINGGTDAEIKKNLDEVRARATKKKRKIKFAMNAWVVQKQTDVAAMKHLEKLFADRDQKPIKYFRNVMADPKSGTTMWEGGNLSDRRMLDSNDGLQAGLVGSAETIISRIKALEKAGIDIMLLQFENMMEGTVKFGKNILPAVNKPKRR